MSSARALGSKMAHKKDFSGSISEAGH